MVRNSFAPGKIILSGEYAVLFGYPGIAAPSSLGVQAIFEESVAHEGVTTKWPRHEHWLPYVEKIINTCRKKEGLSGRLTIHSDVPVGKGMGSSTALVIAIVRALIGDGARQAALDIENVLNPGHSGFDFAVIWEGAPVLYQKNAGPSPVDLPAGLLKDALLIDTGLPKESTTELVAWMKGRETEIQEPLKVIGNCTERLLQGESLDLVMRDHHKAQVELGVVPTDVQQLIAAIESTGGAGKVIGAGSRTGGAGMVLTLGDQKEIRDIAGSRSMPVLSI